MRNLIIPLLAAGALVLSTAPVHADLGDQLFELLADDGAPNDQFGISIAIDNGIVAVGAWHEDVNGSESGSAYLFDAATGVQLFELLPNDGATGDRFGISIAIDNGIVAVGAMDNDDNGSNSGSAYLFNADTGAQIGKLLPTAGAAGDKFGTSIAIDNGIVAVGAIGDDNNGSQSGSVHLFIASNGSPIATLFPTDGAAGDNFGSSIAMNNGIVAVGARLNDDNGSNSGSAYLFDAKDFFQIFKLLPDDGAAHDWFGTSIAMNNGVVAVGAMGDDNNNGEGSGSAYLFDASTGVELFKLLPDDGANFDFFGKSIAIDNGIVAAGAPDDNDNGEFSGSAYLFDASTGAQLFKVVPDDGAAEDGFGRSIAIDNGVVAVGATGHNDNGDNSGSAYLFDAASCPWDLDGTGTVGATDLLSLLVTWGPCDDCNDCPADFDGNCTVGASDLLALLVNWGPCP